MSDASYGTEPASQPPRSNGPAIAAIITGIIALLLSWIPAINLLAIVLGIVALVTGFMGLRNAGTPGVGGKGLAVTGLVTGVLALVISVLVYVGLASFFSDPEVQQQIRETQSELENIAPTEG